MNAVDVVGATNGVSLIVHAVNPPGYRDWAKLVLPMLDSSIAAAKASGARILFPGTATISGPTPGRSCARIRRSIRKHAKGRSVRKWSAA